MNLRALFLFLLLAVPSTSWGDKAVAESVPSAAASEQVLISYRRLLPLEGGSNFRDLGGYPTADGHTVKRGLLFRSGAMTGLTEGDEEYLQQFGFQSVVDLRSTEEVELYPNRWAKSAELSYRHHDYSIVAMMRQAAPGTEEKPSDYSAMYLQMMEFLKPQLTMYFETLLNAEVPAVVNCSAGQDRTGVTSALLLTALGVDRELIIEDYLLSTDFREPKKEKGDVDLAVAAKTNAFAAMMLKFSEGQDSSRPNPLVTKDGTPFLQFTFESIEAQYGDVVSYLASELGVDAAELALLRQMYLES
ncbi:tyrosine-protein phosphatase [Congregibacter brevis]|uniref:Tyrosine-protein phosphatase n=1 Tax=Congregibacter brevis TaxID=3081201 RepID=A0ABZ0II47_9GAMM|nr:tyrosine-protein phosphatase [Congregibacter sp. IMCC45268]